MSETIILSGVEDIDVKIFYYLDLATLNNLVDFNNTREIIIEILPDLITELISKHVDIKEINSPPKLINGRPLKTITLDKNWSFQNVLRQTAKLILLLLEYNECDIMHKIDALVLNLTKQDNFCDILGICLLRDIELTFSQSTINNYICYVCNENLENFIKYFERILYNGLFELGECMFIRNYRGLQFPEQTTINYLKRFLLPAMEHKAYSIINYIINYWRIARNDFESKESQHDMDIMIVEALKVEFQLI